MKLSVVGHKENAMRHYLHPSSTKPNVAHPALRFLFSWTLQHALIFLKALLVGIVAIGVLSATVLRLLPNAAMEAFVTSFILGGLVGMLIGETQQKVLRHFHIWDAEHWRLVSALGGAMGGVLLFIIINNSGSLHQVYFGSRNIAVPRGRWVSQIPSWWLMPSFMGALAFAQSVFLRRFVARAWLWWLACVMGAMMFSQFAFASSLRLESIWYLLYLALVVSIQGFVMGCTWLVMWSSQPSLTQSVSAPNARANPAEPSVWDDAI